MILLLRKQPQLRSPASSSSASSIASSSSSFLNVFKKAPLLDGSKSGEEIKRKDDSSLPSSPSQVRLFYILYKLYLDKLFYSYRPKQRLLQQKSH